jgi:hypothetical protein
MSNRHSGSNLATSGLNNADDFARASGRSSMSHPRVWLLLAVGMLAASCTSMRSTQAGTATTPSTSAADAAERRGVAARYLAIATIGNRGLDALDALAGRDRDDLAAARTDLYDAAATERRFDRGLLAIGFPSEIEGTARALIAVNESRAALTSEAAASTSLRQLLRYEMQLVTANGHVEQQVRIIRSRLGLPSPETN